MSDLAIRGEDTSMVLSSNVEELTALANRLMMFPPQGKSLTGPQAAIFAAHAFMLKAKPYAKELMWTDKGPQIGIPYYRRMAKQYNLRNHGSEFGYRKTVRIAQPGEINQPGFSAADGDIAIIVTIIDEYQFSKWQADWADNYKMVADRGGTHDQAALVADNLAGPKPEHHGLGIVSRFENFSGDLYVNGKKVNGEKAPEMWARMERAEKRAEKNALQKAYPAMMEDIDNLESNGQTELMETVTILEHKIDNMLEARSTAHLQPGWSKDKVMEDLGFSTPEYIDGEITDGAPDIPVPADDPIAAYDIASDSPEADENPNRFSDDTIDMLLTANVGIKDRDKLIGALNRSKILVEGMDAKWFKMWVSFYAAAMRKQLNQDASAERADNNVANVKDQEETA